MTRTFKTPPAEILETLIDRCLKEGATAADCSLGISEGVSVDVRDGKLENVERSESQGIALRVLFGQRQAHVSGSDLSDDAITAMAERCVAMAKAVPEDKFAGLAPEELLAKDPPVLDLEGDGEIPIDRLESDAIAAEAAALAVDGVKTVSGCGNGWSRTERWVAASNGFSSYLSGGSTGLGLAAVAERHSGAVGATGLTAGIFWGTAHLGCVQATKYLGMSLGVPLAQAAVVISGLWGVAVFEEGRGPAALSVFAAGAAALAVGAALLVLAAA